MDTYYLSNLRFPKDQSENARTLCSLHQPLSTQSKPLNHATTQRGLQGPPPRTRGDLGPHALACDRSFFTIGIMYVPIFGSPPDGPGDRPPPASSAPASQVQAMPSTAADIFDLASDSPRRGFPLGASGGRASSAASPSSARHRERSSKGLFSPSSAASGSAGDTTSPTDLAAASPLRGRGHLDREQDDSPPDARSRSRSSSPSRRPSHVFSPPGGAAC